MAIRPQHRRQHQSCVGGTIERMESRLLLTSNRMLEDYNDFEENYAIPYVEEFEGDIYFSYSKSSEIWKLEDGAGAPQFVTDLQPQVQGDLSFLTRLDDRLLVGMEGGEWFELFALQPSTGNEERLFSRGAGLRVTDVARGDNFLTFRYTDWHTFEPVQFITDGTPRGAHQLWSSSLVSIDEIARTDGGTFFTNHQTTLGS